jgi:hypothetical protein
MNKGIRVIKTKEEFKIFADQYRMKIIDVYAEKNIPMTVKMVADYMKEVPAKVHYHVQKLLKINILSLDHIEVINGINAKYYTLNDNSFRIDIEGDDSPKMKEFQIDATLSIVFKNIDNFKNDIIMRAEAAKKSGNVKVKEGFVSQKNIFLSDDELDELKRLVFEFVSKHEVFDETKPKYSFLAGIFKKEE